MSKKMLSGKHSSNQASLALTNQNQNSTSGMSANSGVDQGVSAALDGSGVDAPDEKRSDEKPDEAFRQQVMAYANQNLNKLATPPANDKWDVPTFYFVGNSNVYVELYAIDTDLAGQKMLYKAEKDSNGQIKLTEVARYKEGEDDWVLSSGKDDYDNYVMEEYDYNEDTKKWEKTDEFTDDTSGSTDANSNDNSTGSGLKPIVQ